MRGTKVGGPARRVDEIIDAHDVADGPGGVLGVYVDGEIVYARGFGMANVEHRIPNTASTAFRLGSVSKQFTAMAVAILAQRGRLDLDADVRVLVPELPEYAQGVVTARHLVHHTSGIRDYNELALLAGRRPDRLATAREALELLARQRRLNFPPGERYLYSNSGYFLLGVLVERATGQPLAAFAHEQLFEPLGMTHSCFKDDHGAVVPNRAFGYVPDAEGGWRLYLSQRDFVGAGGVFSTVEDMLPWLVNQDDNRLGGPELGALVHEVGVLNHGTAFDYAFGLRVATDRGLRLVHNPGRFAAFKAHTMRYPSQGLALLAAVNGGMPNPTRLCHRIAHLYLERLVPGLPPRPAPVCVDAPPPTHPELRAPSGDTDPARFEGSYHAPELDATYDVSAEEDGLVLTLPDGATRSLRASEEDAFRGDGLTVRFRSKGDEVEGFALDADFVVGLLFDRV